MPGDALEAPSARLEDILTARDERAALQSRLMTAWSCPVVSMTLVSPGPVKDDPRRRVLMDRAEAALEGAVAAEGYAVRERLRLDGVAGPEAVYAINAPAMALKTLAIRLEDSLPWGRLWDADVLVGAGSADVLVGAGFADSRASQDYPTGLPQPLSRADLGLAPRACLICGADLRRCMALRSHPITELAAEVERLISLAIGPMTHDD